MANKLAASIFTSQEGHLSIAESIAEILKKHHFTTHLNKVYNKSEFSPSKVFCIFFPQLFALPYKLSGSQRFLKLVRSYTILSHQNKITRHLKKQKSQVVISTWFPHNYVLQQVNTHNHYLSLNIISDPRTIGGYLLDKDAYNFVFDQKAVNQCLRLGLPKNKIIQSGWFVRQRFQEPYQKNQVRRQLGIDQNKLTILVVAGSEGTNAILKIIPAFINCSTPLEVIFACGKNKSLFSTIKTLARLLSTTNGKKNTVNLTPLSFTKNIHLYLQAADLAIGKAGPNLIFESVATHTPFFAITHMSGQETGNLDIIKEYQLGYVEEKAFKAIKLLKEIIKHPKALNKFTKPLQTLAQKNNASQQILANFLHQNLPNLFVIPRHPEQG